MDNVIETVTEARAGGDHAGALRAAVAEWRRCRAAEIADAVDVLTEEALRGFSPPSPRKNADFHRAWLELLGSGDPVAAGWLAENLITKLPGTLSDDKIDPLMVRIRRIGKAADPRFAAAVVRLLEQAPPITGFVVVNDALRRALKTIGDERTRRDLGALAEKETKREAARLRRLIKGLPAPGALSAADRAAWARAFGGRRRDETAERGALLRAVLEAPDDDDPRAVYADWLVERGDPRGEFIALQLQEEAGQASPAAVKRATALLKEHKKTWLGSLLRVTYRAWFRRGFLFRLELDGSWRATGKAWEEHARDPMLATVVELGGKATPEIYARFITSPAMRSLRSVAIWADPILEALEQAPLPRINAVECFDWKRGDYDSRFVERVLPLLESMPGVNELNCDVEVLEPLRRSEVFRRVGTLCVQGDSEAVFSRWSEMPDHVRRYGWIEYIELRRTPDGTVCFIGSGGWDELDDVAPHLPGDLARVEIEAPKKKVDAAGIQKALSRAGVRAELVLGEPVKRSGLATGLAP